MLLHCHTCYSLRHGLLQEEEWIDIAINENRKFACITDINNTTAALNFIRLAQKNNITPIVGVDVRNNFAFLYLLVAKNNEGFFEINQYISSHLHEKKPFPNRPTLSDNYLVIYPYNAQYTDLSENEYVGVTLEEISKIPFGIYATQTHRLILKPISTFRHNRDFNLHKILRAIDNNSLLSTLDPQQVSASDNKIYSNQELINLSQAAPYLITQLENIVAQCNLEFAFGSETRDMQNLMTFCGDSQSDINLLRQLCNDNLNKRYPIATPAVHQRIDKELALIQQMNFVTFFLINWDIVRYAKSKGYFTVGRGSGANSIVAYLLGITNVDPIELDLYFERFLNMYRSSPPDFDIDFSWKDREDVTDYIFKKYGASGQCALLGAYSTFQSHSAIREVAKVFGLPKEEIDKLVDYKKSHIKLDDLSKLIIQYANLLLDKPNILTVHSAGIVITEKPINYFVTTHLPPKGFPTAQFDMLIAEDVGIYKFDILGQRGLAKIQESLELIKSNQDVDISEEIHDISKLKQDAKINQLLKSASCIGCFYVESPAMRMLLQKLEVNTYLELVAASSIIRPGVAKSGMMQEYIRRHKTPALRQEAIPELLEIMPDTYGIMVYQEDVLKVAHYYGGLSLAEADILRRAMSGKFRNKKSFSELKSKFFKHCKNQNRVLSTIGIIWYQIESFAGYAFAKGHSASFAVESYQTLFLKAYYPIEYMVATLNNGGGFYSREFYFLEAKKNGALIELPEINTSDYYNIVKQKTIFLGFMNLENLQLSTIKIIVNERKNGQFISFQNFIDRVKISQEQIDILIRIEAFRNFDKDYKKLMWISRFLFNHSTNFSSNTIFEKEDKKFSLPNFEYDAYSKYIEQIDLLGFSLESSFQFLKGQNGDSILAKSISSFLNRTVSLIGQLVTYKTTYTSSGDRMYFGTFVDELGDYIDTVHFSEAAKLFPFKGHGIYHLKGKVSESFGFFSVEVSEMKKIALTIN